ncbi:unnamed protein product [Protopolystoma xenopodis]|uniref:Uncharacterized protein n=1 Tax=Protopolystoma xenopodis TaxID=117903 RepID=A0A3S5B2W9_9PLAT|nr:unnamed protein product [Protopolystoma xenopodis]
MRCPGKEDPISAANYHECCYRSAECEPNALEWAMMRLFQRDTLQSRDFGGIARAIMLRDGELKALSCKLCFISSRLTIDMTPPLASFALQPLTLQSTTFDCLVRARMAPLSFWNVICFASSIERLFTGNTKRQEQQMLHLCSIHTN